MPMLKELLAQKAKVDADIERMEALRADIVAAIHAQVASDLTEMRRITGKETGTVAATKDGVKVTETITKKVEWDQDLLSGIVKRITAAGDDVSRYVRTKYDVPEKMWNEMHPDAQSAISPARTTKPGKPVIKIEEVAP